MAANTSFADFPRLSALHAGDGFLPRQLTFKGSRLVYLARHRRSGADCIASDHRLPRQRHCLIPLYAIGVFLSFTLSQTGMARRWWKSGHLSQVRRSWSQVRSLRTIAVGGSRWSSTALGRSRLRGDVGFCRHQVSRRRLDHSGVGSSSGCRFLRHPSPLQGPGLASVAGGFQPAPHVTRQRVIVPISGVHRGTLAALRYARTLSPDVTVVHVSIDPDDAAKVRRKWEFWGEGVRLVILESPYRLLVEPLLQYIDQIDAQRQPNEIITVVVPEFVPAPVAAPSTGLSPASGGARPNSHVRSLSDGSSPVLSSAVALQRPGTALKRLL